MQEINSENCIKFLIESTNLYACDSDGYIIRATDGEKIFINSADKTNKSSLILPMKLITDDSATILNPFNEILGETEDQKWFYVAMAMSISFKIKSILNWIIQYSKLKEDVTSKSLKFISQFAESIDDKTKKEIETISIDMLEFSNTFYNRKLKTTLFRMGIFEENFRSKFSSVRKKTWKLLKEIFSVIFKFEENDEEEFKDLFKYKSSKITCPRFESFLNVYLSVISYINEICDIFDADDHSVDIDELSFHIRNIDNYYNKLKWLSQDNICKEEPAINLANDRNIPFTNNNQHEAGEESFISSILKTQNNQIAYNNNNNMTMPNQFMQQNRMNPQMNYGFGQAQFHPQPATVPNIMNNKSFVPF